MKHYSRNKLITAAIILTAMLCFAGFSIVGLRYLLAPSLHRYIAKQAAHYGVKFATQTMQLNGAIHLTQLQLPLKSGIILHIDDATIRPSFLFIPGYVQASNLNLHNQNMQLHIASVDANDISRNTNIAEPSLLKNFGTFTKTLYKYNIGSIKLRDGQISFSRDDALNENVLFQTMSMSGLKNARINVLRLAGTQIKLASPTSPTISNLGYITANQLDLGHMFALYNRDNRQQTTSNEISYSIWQQLDIQNVKVSNTIAGVGYNAGASGFSLDRLTCGPFYTKSFPLIFTKLLKQAMQDKDKQAALEALKITADRVIEASANLQHLNLNTSSLSITLEKLALIPHEWDGIVPKKLFLKLDKLVLKPSVTSALYTSSAPAPLAMSGLLNLSYNQPDKSLEIKQANFAVGNLCQIDANVQLTHVDPSLFTNELSVETLGNISFKSSNLLYVDRGVVPVITRSLSQATQLPYADIKELIYTIIEKSPGLLISDAMLAQKLATILKDIAEHQQIIKIAAESKLPSGLNLSEWQENPASAMNNISLHIEQKEL